VTVLSVPAVDRLRSDCPQSSRKSDRDRRRRLTALQGEVAVADQRRHLAVTNPNRQAPQLTRADNRSIRLGGIGGSTATWLSARFQAQPEPFLSDSVLEGVGG
jgi:hypothetical protein